MKRLLSTTLLAAFALGSLTACSSEPGGEPSASAGSSLTASPSEAPAASGTPSTSPSPTAPGSSATPTSPATSGQSPSSPTDSPGGSTTDIVIESVDGNWLTPHTENAVALLEEDGTAQGFTIVLGGSGTEACAPSIMQAAVEGTSLQITLAPLASDLICTKDLRPYNFRVLFPGAETIDTVNIGYDPNIGPRETFTKEQFARVTR
ncbi:MAG: hypothetical protein QM705_15995 [Ancrocorticia sp.]